MTDPSGVTECRYDALDRLVSAGPTGMYAYTYGGNSNRLSDTANGTRTEATYDATNRLTKRGATTYSYDANGNFTSVSDGPTLSYNAADQTTRYKAPGLLGATTDMAYADADQSARTKAGATTFTTGLAWLSPPRPVLLTSESTYYTHDNQGDLVGQRIPKGKHYYLFDGLGSVAAVTEVSGKVVNRFAYDPYGNRISGTTEAVPNPWQFAGGHRDGFSGYYKFGTRYYDPALGRWTQRTRLPRELPHASAGDNAGKLHGCDGQECC